MNSLFRTQIIFAKQTLYAQNPRTHSTQYRSTPASLFCRERLQNSCDSLFLFTQL